MVAVWSCLVLGAGNAVLDVAGFSLLQRTLPNAVRGRVFGLLEAIVMLGLSLGSALAPLLVAVLDIRGALIATGAAAAGARHPDLADGAQDGRPGGHPGTPDACPARRCRCSGSCR